MTGSHLKGNDIKVKEKFDANLSMGVMVSAIWWVV